MRYLLALVLLLGFSSSAFAQGIRVETNQYATLVQVQDPSFAPMCEAFAKRLSLPSGESVITLKPKLVRIGQIAGEVWVISFGKDQFEVSYTELPSTLQRLRGEVARNVLQGTCRTENGFFYSKGEVVIITATPRDGLEVENALKP